MLVEKLQSAGIKLRVTGSKLLVDNGKPLTEIQRAFIRENKQKIIAELTPAARLRKSACKYRLDPDELTDWYHNDFEDIQNLDDTDLDMMVRDYAVNRPNFRNEKPLAAYQLWYYKLDPKSTGFIQQGVMTSNEEEARTRLEKVYGKPVYELQINTTEEN